MNIEQFLNDYLKTSPELADNLKEGTIPQLAAKLGGTYVVRADKANQWHLVHRGTNEQADPGATINKASWDYLKRRGASRYLPRFMDRRTANQIAADAIETKIEFQNYLKKLPTKWINDEPTRVLTDWVAKNCLFECDGRSAPVFALMHNGVAVERITGDQLVNRISQYMDQTSSELESKRLAAKWRNEALSLQGLTPEDLRNDPQARGGVDRVIELLKGQYYASPTKKRLPNFDPGELVSDLQKETAHDLGFPVDSTQWDSEQRRAVSGSGERRIEQVKENAWGVLNNFVSSRPASLYTDYISSDEQFEGLEYKSVE